MCGNVMLLSKHDACLLVRNKTVYRLEQQNFTYSALWNARIERICRKTTGTISTLTRLPRNNLLLDLEACKRVC
jgi:hypothetical protein